MRRVTAFDQPASFATSLSRLSANPVQPNLTRAYRETQFFFFAQDTFRISSRLVLNAGLRYDNFGGPVSTGPDRDPTVVLGASGAQLVPSTANSSLYPGANRSFAPRAGFSWDILPQAHALLRGGYGIFYDRLVDNLWLNARSNSFYSNLASLRWRLADSQRAAAGEILSMYVSGLAEGGAIPPRVAVGSRLAEILYFGDAPGYPGYYQVNFRMPAFTISAASLSWIQIVACRLW